MHMTAAHIEHTLTLTCKQSQLPNPPETAAGCCLAAAFAIPAGNLQKLATREARDSRRTTVRSRRTTREASGRGGRGHHRRGLGLAAHRRWSSCMRAFGGEEGPGLTAAVENETRAGKTGGQKIKRLREKKRVDRKNRVAPRGRKNLASDLRRTYEKVASKVASRVASYVRARARNILLESAQMPPSNSSCEGNVLLIKAIRITSKLPRTGSALELVLSRP